MSATTAAIPPRPAPARALVLTGFGINCEEELAAAYRLAGAEARVAHLNEVLGGEVRLGDFDVLNLPGGFSFGDDLGSGKVLANRMRFRRLPGGETLFEAIRRFVAGGNFVLGICNGFQALVKLGLLPDVAGRAEQEVTLARNRSGRYEDRWCTCRVNPRARTPFLAGIATLRVPVRHGEGRLVIRDEAIRRAIVEGALDCLAYCDESGQPTDRYPLNPNGAELACAGLTDRTGHVLGMMPHPEACLSLYNDPCWPQLKRAGKAPAGEEGPGLQLFKNIVSHIAARKAGDPARGRGAVASPRTGEGDEGTRQPAQPGGSGSPLLPRPGEEGAAGPAGSPDPRRRGSSGGAR